MTVVESGSDATTTGGTSRRVVDAHVHFWDPRVLHYPWLRPLPTLQRPFLLGDYETAVGNVQVEKCVVVECNCLSGEATCEVKLFERLGDSDSRVAGIVAFADLTNAGARDETLACLSARSQVKGIRQNIQGEKPGFALQDAFVGGVRKLGSLGLTFDLCVTHDQLEEANALVSRCPGTQFVLDHCGKPPIRTGARQPWKRDLARLAAHDNVCCKVSGLLTEADPARHDDDEVLAYAMQAVECFGIDRLLYGSDWPVLTLAGKYGSWFEVTTRLTDGWSENECHAFYAANATRVYRL